MNTFHPREDPQIAFTERLSTAPPFFPAVEILAHLRKRSTGMSKRARLVSWRPTYRLAVERRFDDAALTEVATITKWATEPSPAPKYTRQ